MAKKDDTPEVEFIPNRKKATKYEPWMCEEIIKVAEDGGHVAQMCVNIGVRSRDTFYRWLNEYPEFKEAYEYSKIVSQSIFERVGLKGMMGEIKGFNYNSWVTTMNNKFPAEYKRSATGSNTEVNIGSITSNTIKSLTDEQLNEKLEYLQERIKLGSDDTE